MIKVTRKSNLLQYTSSCVLFNINQFNNKLLLRFFPEFTTLLIRRVGISCHYDRAKHAGGLAVESVFHHLLITAPENRRVP